MSAAVLAPVLAPHSPNVQDLTSTLAPPNGEHLLGTDDLGRDQLSRLLFGLRTSLAISAAVTLGVMIIGLPLGMLAGFTRGIANTVIARVIDVGLALPSLLLALALIAAMGAGVTSTVIALVAGYTPYLARVTRSVVLKIREEEYIDSAAVSGVPTWRIIVRHVTPNMIESVSVQLTLIFAFTVIAEAGLSFVGLGIQPPTSSSGQHARPRVDPQHRPAFDVDSPRMHHRPRRHHFAGLWRRPSPRARPEEQPMTIPLLSITDLRVALADNPALRPVDGVSFHIKFG